MSVPAITTCAIIAAFLICYIIRSYINECRGQIDIENIDFVLYDNNEEATAFITLVNKNKEIDQEVLKQINKTLIDNFGYRIFYVKK